MAIDRSDLEYLSVYLLNRENYLTECNSSFENILDGNIQKIINPDGVGVPHLSKELNEQLTHFDRHIRDEFRKVMYVGVCTFLNEMIELFAKTAIPEYKKKHDTESGSDVSRNTNLLSKECGVDFGEYAQRADDLCLVRNCLVHKWGKVSTFRNADRLRAVIGQLKIGDEQVWNVVDDQLHDDGATCLALSTCIGIRYRLVAHFES